MCKTTNSPWQRHSEQSVVSTGFRQQSSPSNLQLGLLFSSLQIPSPTEEGGCPAAQVSWRKQVQLEHWSLIVMPQQSPPSYWHDAILVSSLQMPSPIQKLFKQTVW